MLAEVLPPPPPGKPLYPPTRIFEVEARAKPDLVPTPPEKDIWELYVDGSAIGNIGGAGIYLRSPEGAELEHAVRLDFQVSNNEAEYEALLAGLKFAKSILAKKVKAFTDSQLVQAQFSGSFATKAPPLLKYLDQIKTLVAHFD